MQGRNGRMAQRRKGKREVPLKVTENYSQVWVSKTSEIIYTTC